MSTNNYFRIGFETFFFDVNEPASILEAWTLVLMSVDAEHPAPCVFKPFRTQGPWTGCDVIGMQSVGYKPTHDLLVNGWLERRKAVDTLWSVT